MKRFCKLGGVVHSTEATIMPKAAFLMFSVFNLKDEVAFEGGGTVRMIKKSYSR